MEKPLTKNPVIIAVKSSQVRITLKRALDRITNHPEDLNFFRDIESGFAELKSFMSSDIEVDLVVTDIFLSEEFTIFTLIREMEKIPKLWNVPVLIYTSEPDIEMFNKIRKDIIHLPFRVLPTTLDEKEVEDTCRGLLEFKKENRHYLELKTKIFSLVELGDDSILPSALKMIDKMAEKHRQVLHSAKVFHLKGQLYYRFWQQKNADLEPLVNELGKYSPLDDEFIKTKKKIKSLSQANEGFLYNAESNFLVVYGKSPKYWQNLHSLYTLYMDQNNIKEAKKYLSELIKIFPEESKYSFKMGKINELEGDFSSAVRNYLTSSKSLIDEGVAGFDIKDVMEIIDASLNSSKNILNDMNLSNLTDHNLTVGSREYMLIRTLKQNNAMSRRALTHIAKKVPNDPEVYNKIGITYRRTGDFKMALEMYSRALKLEPDNHRIRINYSVAFALFGLWEKASKELGKARKLNTDRDDEEIIAMLSEVVAKKDSATLGKMVV